MEITQFNKSNRSGFWTICLGVSIAVILLIGMSGLALSFEINTKNEDIQIRIDNTFRYNYGVRLETPDNMYLLNSNMDDGNRNFDKGTVTNRLDLLTELDLIYKRNYGVRLSGAFWYDQRYHDPLGNDSITTSNRIKNGQQALGLSQETKDLFAGPYGELLDAFAFGQITAGQVPINLKIGRHTIYWGESLYSFLNGICYSQFPVDLAKGTAVPGTEAKELFRPLFNISGQAQITSCLSISAQYFLEWEANRFPEAGSYWSTTDMLSEGGQSLILAPGYFVLRGHDVEPDGKNDWGVALHLSPRFLGGNLGLYYRRVTDKMPQINVDLANGKYYLAYGDGIDIYGISLSKVIYGLSVGIEYSYRKDMPLMTGAVITDPSIHLDEGELFGARGNTHHFLINIIGLIAKTPLFDTASYNAELTYNSWDKVTQGEQWFMGGAYDGFDRATKEAWAIQAGFSPTWYAVLPGIDLTMPITYGVGLSGVSAVSAGTEDSYNAGIGLQLDIYQKYLLTLNYVTYHGDTKKDPATGELLSHRGGAMNDRDTLSLTFKFTL